MTNVLTTEFGKKISVKQQTYSGSESGAFEVRLNGRLIHSKLKLKHGKCQSDEELDNIIESIEALLPVAKRVDPEPAEQDPHQ